MKEIPKLRLITSVNIYSYLQEPDILKKFIGKNFIQTLISSFQDYENLYLITDYYEGNNLFFYKDDLLSEEQIKFIAANIIQSFIYLRERNIIHRDISMKNLILNKDGYLNLLDFSYAIAYKNRRNYNYLICKYPLDNAPEIKSRKNYEYNLDYYKLGANIIYYLLFKKYANEIKEERNITDLKLNYKDFKNVSYYRIDFLNKLIISNTKNRIGYNSINELKNHKWFNGFNWNKLENKKIKSPLLFNIRKLKILNEKCSGFNFSDKIKIKFEIQQKKDYFKKLIKKYNQINEKKIHQILDKYQA